MNALTLKQKLLGFQLIAQEKLQAVICSIPGKKDLIIQSSLIKPLEHICGASWLKLKGIQRIYKLNEDNSIPIQPQNTTDQHRQLYMVSSDLVIFQSIVNCIKLIYENQLQSNALLDNDIHLKHFHIICVPSCFTYFHHILEQNGLYGIVGLHRFNWDFISMDDNVLSLEIPKVFSSVYVKSDFSLFSSIAQSLRIMQLLCGTPDYILTYGDHSENIRKILQQLGPLNNTTTSSIPNINKDNFNKWIIIDRDKDYASALLTPSIYAGLLLEVFQCKTGIIDLELIDSDNKIIRQKLPLLMVPAQQQNTIYEKTENVSAAECSDSKRDNEQRKTVKSINKNVLHLNVQQDRIFGENRYKNFTAVSQEIRMQVRTISKELQNLNTMKLQEMHDYVNRKLPKITELKSRLLCHLMASETIIEMLAKYVRKIKTIEEDILINTKNYGNLNITSSSLRKSILNDIDELLIIEPQRFNSFRLFCLLHICMGINTDELMNFIKKYCNYFGYQNVLMFHKIAQAKLLPQLDNENMDGLNIKVATTKILSTLKPALNNIATKFQHTQTPSAKATTFQLDANIYKLIIPLSSPAPSAAATATAIVDDNKINESPSNSTENEGNNSNNNNNNYLGPQYIFNGMYIPFIAQLCKYCLDAKNLRELIMKMNPGDIDNGIKLNGQPLKYHVNQQQLLKQHDGDSDNNGNVNDHDNPGTGAIFNDDDVDGNKSNIFVYIVGGITYAEIAACHLIGKQYNANIIVASDCILSGSDLIEQCFL